MLVSIGTDERGPLRSASRDLQLSVSRYYAGTASGEDLGALVRAFISHTQTINDWLTNVIVDAASYKANFQSSRHVLADYIEAVKYVRNVSEHVMHIVKPDDKVRVVGGKFGMRLYARWEAIPPAVDARLRANTRALRPHYESKLQDREVMSTMMQVLRFYADIAP